MTASVAEDIADATDRHFAVLSARTVHVLSPFLNWGQTAHRGIGLRIEPHQRGAVAVATDGCALLAVLDDAGRTRAPMSVWLPKRIRAACAPFRPPKLFSEGDGMQAPVPAWMRPGRVVFLSISCWVECADTSGEFGGAQLAHGMADTRNYWRADEYRLLDPAEFPDWRSAFKREWRREVDAAGLHPRLLARFRRVAPNAIRLFGCGEPDGPVLVRPLAPEGMEAPPAAAGIIMPVRDDGGLAAEAPGWLRETGASPSQPPAEEAEAAGHTAAGDEP